MLMSRFFASSIGPGVKYATCRRLNQFLDVLRSVHRAAPPLSKPFHYLFACVTLLTPPHTSLFFVVEQQTIGLKSGQFLSGHNLAAHYPIFRQPTKIYNYRLVCGEFRRVYDKIEPCRAISDSPRFQNILTGHVA